MRKKIVLLLCSFQIIILSAQKYEFLNVPKFNEADLTKQKSLIDETAPAEIIYRSCYFRIDNEKNRLLKTYNYKVKIYDKDKAEDWLNLEIPLYKNSTGEESLAKIKAYTHNVENGKPISTIVDKSSKYKSKESKNITINKFAFPNVKNGSVIEYEYQVESPFYFSLPQFIIETNTPSLYTEYVLDVPSNISYNINYTGSLKPKYRVIEEKTIYGALHKTYRFGFDNLKAFKTEKHVKNDDNYRTKIDAEVHSTNFSELKLYSSSWDKIKDRLYQDDEFGGELRKNSIIKEIMPKELLEIKDTMERANSIFKFVQKTFTYNDKRGIYTEDGIKNLIKTKIGNAAEINLLLVGMLRLAKIEADPMLISTVGNGLINLSSPNISNLNFVIAVFEVDKGIHVYDATSKQSAMDELPPRDWNKYGIIINKEKAKQIEMNNSKPSITYLTVNAKINENGTVSGKYSDRDTGTFAMLVKEQYDESADKYKKTYKDNFSVDFDNIESKVLESGDFESTMNFSSNDMIDKVGKKMIINPLLFLGKSSNEFDQTEERKFNIDFVSPYSKVKKVVLEIPEGYIVDELPKEKKIVTQDKEISYSYEVNQKGNNLEIISTIKVESAEYPKEYYPAFKQIWGTAAKSENQVISLVKKLN
ncbi:DUF3857 domain-containing protein [Chryseobacterium sp.]|uniref:DUF3857 domain-containing protein n=1 Tax=Chryseobacterium sp. TaxID=1871047 RepID=UPI00388E7CD9